MRHIRLTATFAAIALPFAASLAGCGTTQTTSQTKPQATPQQQRENLAWSAEDTRSFARYVGDFVANHESKTYQGAAADKSALLARAEILQQHAQVQAQRIAGLEFDGSPKSINALKDLNTLKDLKARNDGLRRERAALDHEWDVWQVQIGIKKAEDTELSYIPELPEDAGC
jgi:hypothetical protein